MSEPSRIVVVGGGITGLAAAWSAVSRARQAGKSVSVMVLERAARFGGNLITERRDGFVLDGGPDSWVASKPHASALARDLGLGAEIVTTRPETRRYYVALGERLHAVPEGIVLGVPTRIGPLVSTRLFTWRGKARMALEPFVKARRYEGDEDESIASFAARRLGHEAADRLVAPLLGGISAGDANELSIRATFPQLVAMEREHGSLVRGSLAARRARAAGSGTNGKGGGGAFESLARGIGSLVEALVRRLDAEGVVLRSGSAVRAVERTGASWSVRLEDGEAVVADAVLIAGPAHAAASLLAPVDTELCEMLRAIRYGSTATVFLAFRRQDVTHPLDGVGFVVPKSLGRAILASTWVSSKWADRAPEGHVLLRAFLGGPSGEAVLRRDDAGLREAARGELAALMGLRAEPTWSRVFRFDRASAQMRVGHLGAVRAIRDRLARVAPGLQIAGGGYGAVGIPDCIRDGQEAGRTLVDLVANLVVSASKGANGIAVNQNSAGST